MKKIFLAVLLSLVFAPLWACTNFLVTKGASSDGSSMITYAADSHELYGELYHWPAAQYPEGAMRDVYEWDTGKYLGRIKQARQTYAVVGNINEHQLSIGETTFTGRKELQNPEGLIDYGSLIYITLQRAKTAREAIKVMTELVAEYGYYSTGESFSIADPDEVWILEMIGKGPDKKGAVWVALKIPDGYVCAHANQARITTFPIQKENDFTNNKQTCYHAPDVIDLAREKGYYDGPDKAFSFSDVYAPVDFGGARFCEARVWAFFRRINSNMEQHADYAMGKVTYDDQKFATNRMPLWIKPNKKLSVHDVMELMRDHFEGTPMDMRKDIGAGPYQCPYRWRPLTWKHNNETYFNERATSTQQTAFSFVAQCRSNFPAPIGGVLWFGVDDTYSTVYMPIYCGIREIPKAIRVGTGDFFTFTWESMFWTFNFVSNFAYSRYNAMIVDIQREQRKLEGNFLTRQPEVDQAALTLYKQSPELARDYLNNYVARQVEMTRQTWKTLGESLLVKYLDGNVKNEYQEPTFPGYGAGWYQRIIDDTDNKFKWQNTPVDSH